ncbi:MAG: TetR/AcrR family transcriptional regulator, partial [Mycobacterium sp.]
IRPGDLLDDEPDAAFRETLAAMNAPLTERVAVLARQLYGNNKPRSVDAVARAVADLPYAVVRRHARNDPMPKWLENDVAASARAVLRSFGEGP